ncbi:MAG: lysophospholipid acyltransferase family protein [Planctomycetes bacterium]|nr:lysophospholipid acyltransferase family protein [Planctomycetota bacterium]
MDESEPGQDAIPLRQRLVAAYLRAVAAFFRVIPRGVAYLLADLLALGILAFACLYERKARRRGRGMRRNMEIVFREELTARRHRKLRRAWARHLAQLGVDFFRMPVITRKNHKEIIDARDAIAELRGLAAEKRGVICVSGHIGHWELNGHVSSLNGVPITIVVRPLANLAVDRFVNGTRASGGMEVISKWGALWGLKKALDAGKIVGLMGDENADHRPVFVPFLGTLASASPAVAELHFACAAPIAVITCNRIARGRYRCHVWDIIRHPPTGDRAADQKEVLTRIGAALSRAILAYPEQWLWGARRFLTRPPGEEPDAGGLPPALPGDRTALQEAAAALERLPRR